MINVQWPKKSLSMNLSLRMNGVNLACSREYKSAKGMQTKRWSIKCKNYYKKGFN